VYGVFHEVVEFAARFGLGVYSSFRRQDSFPNDHPNYLGTLALGAPSSTLNALRDADLVLVLGSRLDEVTTQGYTLPTHQQTLIQVGEDLASHRTHRVPDIEVDCAPGRLVSRMLQLETGAERDWTREHAAYLEASEPPGLADGGGINPGHVIKLLADHLPQDTILTNDAGNFSSFAHRYWRFTHPHTQLGPISGAMGYGVPAAIAAKLAHPGRRVVGLAGDGGFLMTGMELETAVRTGAAITVVVFQNRLYGTIAMHQAKTMGRLAGVDIGDVDIVAMARGLGVAATAVRHQADLDDAIAGLPADAPSLLCVETDPNVISPRTTLDQILPHAIALTPSALH
jgi:acetolactate synthase-1/2/3 large subunit